MHTFSFGIRTRQKTKHQNKDRSFVCTPLLPSILLIQSRLKTTPCSEGEKSACDREISCHLSGPSTSQEGSLGMEQEVELGAKGQVQPSPCFFLLMASVYRHRCENSLPVNVFMCSFLNSHKVRMWLHENLSRQDLVTHLCPWTSLFPLLLCVPLLCDLFPHWFIKSSGSGVTQF